MEESATVLGRYLGLRTEERGGRGVEVGMTVERDEENDGHRVHQMILLDDQSKF